MACSRLEAIEKSDDDLQAGIDEISGGGIEGDEAAFETQWHTKLLFSKAEHKVTFEKIFAKMRIRAVTFSSFKASE